MHKTILACSLVAAALALTGCNEPMYTGPSPGLGDPYPAPINDPQIAVLAPELQPWLGFQPARVTRTETGTMSVEVPMRNLTYEDYQLDYRFIFFDENDMTLTPTMGWAHKPVKSKETVRFTARSLTPDAYNYRLEIKWAR
ncbi:MAG: YcfL family protein [Phycisphaerales bacterium]|nr:YcfL family protein [Phycisphaerales bacterium]